MLIGLALLICLISVPVMRGRLGALAEVRLRAGWLLAVAIGAQIVIISVLPGGSERLHTWVHLGSYALLAAYVAVNLAAIAANGGIMPADPDALAAAGLRLDAGEFSNSSALARPRLAFLGDVFHVPASWPVSNVFSVGDVVLVLGALLALHTICGSRLARYLRHTSIPHQSGLWGGR